jgi:hypothetical protein
MAEEVTEVREDRDQRRYGHLFVSADFMESDLASVAACFEGSVAVHIDFLPHMRRYDYVIWHPELEPVPLGTIPPAYTAVLQKDGDGPVRRIRFERS